MNRFTRLVKLRHIREEAYAIAYSRILANVENLRQSIVKLDEVTEQECLIARQMIGEESGLPTGMVEDFLKGQLWRRQRLEKKIATIQKELDQAKERWLAARVQLKQAEKLEEKEALEQRQEVEKRERKMMDMIGIVQNRPFSN